MTKFEKSVDLTKEEMNLLIGIIANFPIKALPYLSNHDIGYLVGKLRSTIDCYYEVRKNFNTISNVFSGRDGEGVKASALSMKKDFEIGQAFFSNERPDHDNMIPIGRQAIKQSKNSTNYQKCRWCMHGEQYRGDRYMCGLCHQTIQLHDNCIFWYMSEKEVKKFVEKEKDKLDNAIHNTEVVQGLIDKLLDLGRPGKVPFFASPKREQGTIVIIHSKYIEHKMQKKYPWKWMRAIVYNNIAQGTYYRQEFPLSSSRHEYGKESDYYLSDFILFLDKGTFLQVFSEDEFGYLVKEFKEGSEFSKVYEASTFVRGNEILAGKFAKEGVGSFKNDKDDFPPLQF